MVPTSGYLGYIEGRWYRFPKVDLALCRSELAARTQLVDDGAIRNGLAESTHRKPTPDLGCC